MVDLIGGEGRIQQQPQHVGSSPLRHHWNHWQRRFVRTVRNARESLLDVVVSVSDDSFDSVRYKHGAWQVHVADVVLHPLTSNTRWRLAESQRGRIWSSEDALLALKQPHGV